MAGYDSLYFGKVIRDSDLLNEDDNRPYNRVKVLIIGQSSAENELFVHPLGKNNPSTASQKLIDVVDKELYAYVMQPIAGAGTGVRYNATTDLISVSDTGDIKDLNGVPPAEAYFDVTDNYVGGMGASTAGVNPHARAYAPDNRSNSYKGMMSLPGVGANVVVSFMNGVRGMPIVIGVLPSAADVDSIHGMGLSKEIYPNYPFAYSNLKGPNEVVEGGEAGEAAAAGVTDGELTAAEELSQGSSEYMKPGDYSDIPPDERAIYDTFIENGRPDLADQAAADYRARQARMKAGRAEVIELIREERGDAYAAQAAADLQRVNPLDY